MNTQDAVKAILSKSMPAEEAFAQADDKHDVAATLAYILRKAKLVKDGGMGDSINSAMSGATMRTGGPTVDPGAATSIGSAFGKKEMMKTDKNGQWSLSKMEPLSKPPVSEKQRKAMWAAASGHSNLGIPESVGKDFAESDTGGKLPMKKEEDRIQCDRCGAEQEKGFMTQRKGKTICGDCDEELDAKAPKTSIAKAPKTSMKKEEKVYAPVKVQMDSDTYDEPEKHNPDLAAPGKDGGGRLRKSWDTGQWSLEKAIKPGPPLDYSKINPKKNYAEAEAKAPIIDYQSTNMKMPKRTAGVAEHAAGVRAKLDAESKETAAETIARRQKLSQSEGVNIDRESDDESGRGVAKEDSIGGEVGPFSMSEKEPQPGEPGHEADEKKKAKKIKDEADDLLDMHKK